VTRISTPAPTPDAADDPLGPYRAELRAHCYRMLGSAHDAEDVLQEVSVRAWRGRGAFEGRSSLRTWLHRIAVNACLNELERKERRVLPVDLGPAVESGSSPGEPLHEVLWLEPLPDDPEQSAADRETVELAFVAAVQHLPANQRAALIMFEVLGFSAREIADAMDTTPASVNSALQRARAAIEDVLPKRSQQARLLELGDAGQRELVERYSAALREHDMESMLGLLTDDATWSMPPLGGWFRGRERLSAFLADGPFTVEWRHLPARANGQLAVACYKREEASGAFVAYALDVLELRGDRIAAIVAFLDGSLFPAFGLPPALR
jgi:RNA polymerase sigma-70 factor (ECF subfamily)